MAVYLREFANHAAYEAAERGLIKPNVSSCVQEKEVHYNPSSPEPPSDPRLIVVYNVTDTTNETSILGVNNAPALFSSMEVDENEPQSVTSGYTFSTTGEHTIKYTPIDAEHMECGNGVFYNLKTVLSVTIPNTFKSVPDSLLNYCESVTSVTIPNSVETINRLAFRDCSALSSILIPSNVTIIDEEAIRGCTSLSRIDIPDSVTSIGFRSFRYCTGATSVTIGSGITSIDRDAFYDCRNLASVTVNATTPPTLGSRAFDSNASGRKIYVPAASVDAYKAASGWSTYAADILPIQ